MEVFLNCQGEPVRISPKLSCRTSRQRLLSASLLLVKQKTLAVAQENFHPFNLEFVGPNENKVVRRKHRVFPKQFAASQCVLGEARTVLTELHKLFVPEVSQVETQV